MTSPLDASPSSLPTPPPTSAAASAERKPYRRASTVPQEISAAYGLTPSHVERIGVGHINETFAVNDASGSKILVQSINHDVFTEPWKVMENLEAVLGAMPTDTLSLLHTANGSSTALDSEGRTWRAFPFVSDTITYSAPRNQTDVQRTAAAFGAFQRQLAQLDPAKLHETIPRFHDTPHRFEQLDSAIAADAFERADDCADVIEAALGQRPLASRLLDLEHTGDVPIRVVHNDAKIANVLFCETTGEAKCVVDLDTVMAGLSLFDFGDMVRSMCHISEEDERDLERVIAKPELFEALAVGYLESTKELLTPIEREHLLDAGLVLVLEQGVRFLTDHLEGDHYFRRRREGHNLDRARTHFHLLDSLLDQEQALRRLIPR